MSLDQIQAFVVIAEEGSMRRASARLHISQPPLTRRIKSLEDDLGTPLFARVPTGMRLLPAGRTFLAHARSILEAVEAARAALHGGGLRAGAVCAGEGIRAPASRVSPSWPGSPSVLPSARSSSSSS